MFGNHVVAKEWGWHHCGTFQMDSDGKLNNGAIKVENECRKLQRIIK